MTSDRIKQQLLLYGTHIGHWPLPMRAQYLAMQEDPAAQALIAEQAFYEEMLLNHSAVEPASTNLGERIAQAAYFRRQARPMSLSAWLTSLLTTLMPHPAYVFASVVMLGVAVGLSLPAHTDIDTTPPYEEEASL